MAELREIVGGFAGIPVGVVGDLMLDRFTSGDSSRLTPEAPAFVVEVSERRDAPGGAANVAANLAALGGEAHPVGVVGDDPAGARLVELLERAGARTAGVVREEGRATLVKERVLAGGRTLLRLDSGSTNPCRPRARAALEEALRQAHSACRALVVSDYGYGVWDAGLIGLLGRLQARSRRFVVVDSKTPGRFAPLRPDVVKPNFSQAAALLGESPTGDRAEFLEAHASALLDVCAAGAAVVTVDRDGALLLRRDRPAHRARTRPAPAEFCSGAGDTFAAALTLALCSGASHEQAVELAGAAAGVVVTSPYTTTCKASDLDGCLRPAGKVLARPEAAAVVAAHRRAGRRVVFTNGCFDILHRGHVFYLNRARSLGDVLVVGVNSDGSVRALKGPDRPVNPLQDRLEVLAGLACVDHLVAFDEEVPTALIAQLRPDVYVKGGDYTLEMLPEARVVGAYGGEVHILPYVDDRSTSGIIERIRVGGG